MTFDEKKWAAVQSRDQSVDGLFFYGVLTTKIYCRPSCSSRLPLARNVKFYDNAATAERDGLRPCKRCKPLSDTADAHTIELLRGLCRFIEESSDETLSLEVLANRVHMSTFHLQRRFKAVLGVSPKEFSEACRLSLLKAKLRDADSVTAAIIDTGYGSSSRVYERAAQRLGMTPKQYRAGGAGISLSYALSETTLGLLMIGASDQGLCFVQFGESREALIDRLKTEFPAASITEMVRETNRLFAEWMTALGEHMEGINVDLAFPLDMRGTAFQLRVWKYLLKIPSGQVCSYSEVAQAIGHPKAVRAVASACAANRLAIVVPCHRVIRGDGGLGGYRWGMERKRSLIDIERSAFKHLTS